MKEKSSLDIYLVASTEAPVSLLLEADPSRDKINEYLSFSKCYVARKADRTVGVYVLSLRDQGTMELMNIAVEPDCQGQGIGAELLRHCIATATGLGARRLEVGTGAFGYQLAFYQKAGFRAFAVERDFFLNHYREPIVEAGIQHKDMIRLALDL